ncbi:MAG: hypothetical protein Q7T41_02460 [Candidatus Saccharibacteria bacterium]|nr:hypothetical protein [Candidatus Saccharibacteria bacterium]
MVNNKKDNKTVKVFSLKDVRLGSIVGGPWAATYFFYKNLKNIDQPAYARRALIIGILSPIPFVLFDLLLPSASIVFSIVVYLALVLFLTQRYQKAVMRAHEKMNGTFYTTNRAAYVTFSFALLYLLSLFSFNYVMFKSKNSDYTAYDVLNAMFLPQKFDTNKYNSLVAQINSNDTTSIADIKNLDNAIKANTISKSQALNKIDSVLKRYEENSSSINTMNSIKNTPTTLSEQNYYLEEYTKLRIEQIELIRRSIDEETDSYLDEVTALTQKINTLISNNKK